MILSAANVGPDFDFYRNDVFNLAAAAGVSIYPVCFEIPPAARKQNWSTTTIIGGGSTNQSTATTQMGSPTPIPSRTVVKRDFSREYDKYFEFARETAGAGSFFGAPTPGSQPYSPAENSSLENLLAVNIMHMLRDLNGKYSVEVHPSGNSRGKTRIQLKSRRKGVTILWAPRSLRK
jgi:hypothetical protein